jgi:hypothetical protein
MTTNELYFDPISHGNCEILGCSKPAQFRATWANGVVTRLVCATHKSKIEGKLFEELFPATFGRKASGA